MSDFINIKGARENNLKNVDVSIPKNKLVVITGPSGCGKSSLAFDTIYAEGQRRYLESLNSYVRQFLGGNEKPDVDKIEGLSPTISIDQKNTSNNPRSTIGTITEIYDFLRLLYARVGKAYCPHGHGEIETMTNKQIIDNILSLTKEEDKLLVISPVVIHQKGSFSDLFEKLKREGCLRVIVDNAQYSLDEKIELEKNKYHDIKVIIDRIVVHKDSQTRNRIIDAVEQSLKKNNVLHIMVNDKEHIFSKSHTCNVCGFTIPEKEPRLFSFNAPMGACSTCHGLGFTYEPDINKLLPDKDLTINEGGIKYFKNTVNTDNLE
jgi:excinuclease ABC subunit A